MSKTIRNIRRWKKGGYFRLKEIVEGDDTQLSYQNTFVSKNKMKPYAPEGSGKFKAEFHEGTNNRNTSTQHKLEIKNANRSLKKSIRQRLKKDLKNQIENL